jgi:Mycothiol maleylpyruvate isomerase N-terminal domain
MTGDRTWDFLDPRSKGRLLGVLQREIEEMFELAAEPTRWHAPTACEGWELRDMVGHLVAETEGYLSAFDIARRGGSGCGRRPTRRRTTALGALSTHSLPTGGREVFVSLRGCLDGGGSRSCSRIGARSRTGA